MRCVGSLILAALIVLSTSHGARGQGKIEFTNNYPKTGGVAKTIDTEGKLTPDVGWVKVGTTYLHRLWPDGGVEQKISVVENAADTKTWGVVTLQKDLTSGTTYNVTAEIDLWNNMTKQSVTVRTAPATAKAK